MNFRKYSTTDFHPRHLSPEEIANPYLAIQELFDRVDLPDARDLLWKWLKTAAAGNAYKEQQRTDREDVFYIYELITKLLEAAHLICMDKNANDTLSGEKADKNEKDNLKEKNLRPQELQSAA